MFCLMLHATVSYKWDYAVTTSGQIDICLHYSYISMQIYAMLCNSYANTTGM